MTCWCMNWWPYWPRERESEREPDHEILLQATTGGKNHADHVAGLCAECHPNADLTGAAADRKRHDGVESDRGQKECDHARTI